MIIFKSVFRKKTTKAYLLIIICLFLAIGIFLIGKNHYITEGNEKIKKMPNLKVLRKGISRKISTYSNTVFPNSEIVFYTDESLKGFEAIIWQGFVKDSNKFSITDSEIEFLVKRAYSGTGKDKELISFEAFDQLYDRKETVYFLVELANWFDYEKNIKWLSENIEIDNADTVIEGQIINNGDGINQYEKSKKSANLYFFYVKIFTFLSIILGIIFGIVLIYTLINIIIDEKKNSHLLKYLGYHNKTIVIMTLGKIALILVLPLLLSSLVLIPIYLLW